MCRRQRSAAETAAAKGCFCGCGICRSRKFRVTKGGMNHLRKLGLASFLFLGLGLFCGTVGARLGWTPSTALTVTLICYAVDWCWRSSRSCNRAAAKV